MTTTPPLPTCPGRITLADHTIVHCLQLSRNPYHEHHNARYQLSWGDETPGAFIVHSTTPTPLRELKYPYVRVILTMQIEPGRLSETIFSGVADIMNLDKVTGKPSELVLHAFSHDAYTPTP